MGPTPNPGGHTLQTARGFIMTITVEVRASIHHQFCELFKVSHPKLFAAITILVARCNTIDLKESVKLGIKIAQQRPDRTYTCDALRITVSS